MDRKQIKEKSRYVFIREKANQLQESSRCKHTMPGTFMLINRARHIEQYSSDSEESSNATESIERAGITAAGGAERAVRHVKRTRQQNAFYGDTTTTKIRFTMKRICSTNVRVGVRAEQTHFEEDNPVSPQDQMRVKAVNDYKAQMRQKRAEASTSDEDMPEYKEKADRPFIKTRETAQSESKSRQQSAQCTRTMSGQVPEQKAQAIREQGRRLARSTGIKQTVHKQDRRDSAIRKLKAPVVQAAKNSARSALLAGGGFILLLPLLLLFGAAGALFGSSADIGNAPVSDEVKSYAGLIQVYAMEYGIPEYGELIAAVMMQESGGRGSDPMQASESGFNTEYPKTPGGITDPAYSVSVGIQALADCLSMAGVESPEDIEGIRLALQGYNFGSGYISWALRNYGGYSELNALEFSELMAQRMGWTSYGDPYYVQHVLRYYGAIALDSFMGENKKLTKTCN